MSSKKSLNVREILRRFKETHGIKTDIELAHLLGLKPNTIAMWKARNYIDLRLIAEHNEHSLDYIVNGHGFVNNDKSPSVNEPEKDYYIDNNINKRLRALELENAELKGQIKILKELLLNRG